MAEFGVKTPWQAYVRIRLQIYDAFLSDWALILTHRYPHNIALLHDLRGMGYRTGLSTMWHTEQARRVMSILGLTDAFDAIATRDNVENGKPDPEIDLLVAHELRARPEDCLVIEDSPAGGVAALAAGRDASAVTTALTRQKFRGTDLLDRSHIVDDPRTPSTVVRQLIIVHGRPPGD
jgi:beta-phosphoglucomutase-like phosphatase (HAD superfamily)